jgi:hypothetical protein
MNAPLLAQIRLTAEQLAPFCDGDEELFHDMMQGETDIVAVVSRLHEQIARDGEMLVGIGERQAALAERKSRIETRVDRFKEQIGRILRIAQLTKLELPECTWSVRLGKPSLKVVDPLAVPDEYTRVQRVPDKTKINEVFAAQGGLPNWLVREPAKDIVSARKG